MGKKCRKGVMKEKKMIYEEKKETGRRGVERKGNKKMRGEERKQGDIHVFAATAM